MTIVKRTGESCYCPICGTADRFDEVSLIKAKNNTSIIATICLGFGVFWLIMTVLKCLAVEPFNDNFFYVCCTLLLLTFSFMLSLLLVELILRLCYPLGACRCGYCRRTFLIKDKASKGVYVLVGRSGVGKSTVLDYLILLFNYGTLASVTTRPRRQFDEVGHKFITVNMMQKLIEEKDIFCFNCFDSNYYFLLKEQLNGCEVCTLEPHGARALKMQYSDRYVHFIYLDASNELLVKRMRKRGDTEAMIQSRLENDAVIFDDFRECADIVIDASKPAVYVAWQIHQYIKKCEKNHV